MSTNVRDEKDAMALLRDGHKLLREERWAQAEVYFRQAATLSDISEARNNWALCRRLAGDHAGALAVLEPLLRSSRPLPFTRSLASLAMTSLGQREEAGELLQAAIRDLDRGLADPSCRSESVLPAWIEYTLNIKQAAGELEDHRLVLQLHSRWPGRDLPAGAFYAGVAAFNLGRPTRAARYWRGITDPEWASLMRGFARVAEMVNRGTVPPFPLEYDTGSVLGSVRPETEEDLRQLLELGSVKMRWLGMLFEPSQADRSAVYAQGLVLHGGDWGVAFGRRLLEAAVPLPLKQAAGVALVERGIYAPDEEIPVVVNRRPTKVFLRRAEFGMDNPAAAERYQEAIRLRDAGKKEEAYRILSELQLSGQLYPPAMVTLANLQRERGELDQAKSAFESLERVAPNDPGILFNLAGLWLQYGDHRRARGYLERIDRNDLDPQLRRLVEGLDSVLRR